MIELSMRQVIWLRSGETAENELWPGLLRGQLALDTDMRLAVGLNVSL